MSGPFPRTVLRTALALVAASAALPHVAAQMTSPSASQPAPTQPSVPAEQGRPPILDNATAVFQRADRNQDGKLSRQEAASIPAVLAKFDELDIDRDGSLSLAEFTTGFTSGAIVPKR